ncbi:flippase [Flavobacterium sp. RHBU_3]|uniref:flippase n=1 Tax=Flavobacterium sp. RHBU_3 TaxID=3391184 RepID=UPI0039856145
MLKKLLQNETLNHIIVKGGITFGLRMLSMVLSFGSMWFMTHLFGNAFYGVYSLSLTIMQLTALLFGLGLSASFISFTGAFSDEALCRGLLIKCLRLALLAAILPAIIFIFGSGFISATVFDKPNIYPYLQYIAIGMPALVLHELICYYFLSVKKIVTYGIFIFLLPNLLFFILLLVIYFGGIPHFYGFPAFAAAYVLTVIAGLLIIFLPGVSIKYPDFTFSVLLKKSVPMMVGGIFLTLLNWTDILMLGRYASEKDIGIYNNAFRLGYLSLFFVASMNAIIAPKVSELFYQQNFAEMKKVINRSTQLVIALTLPLCLILIFMGKPLLGIFGQENVSGATTLTLITLGGLYNAMTGNVDMILNMTGNQKLASYIFFGGFVINVLLNLYLIPAYGIEGAAGASLICNIIVNTVFVIVIKKKLGFYTFV